MLKMTKVELEKISDADIHLFIEKGIRGGIWFVSKRYSKDISRELFARNKAILFHEFELYFRLNLKYILLDLPI